MTHVSESDLPVGFITPAINQLLAELIDKILSRKDIHIISKPEIDFQRSFECARTNLMRGKFKTISDFKNFVHDVLQIKMQSESILEKAIAEEVHKYFLLKIVLIEQLGSYAFRGVIEKGFEDFQKAWKS